jgi:hypothetical protein
MRQRKPAWHLWAMKGLGFGLILMPLAAHPAHGQDLDAAKTATRQPNDWTRNSRVRY